MPTCVEVTDPADLTDMVARGYRVVGRPHHFQHECLDNCGDTIPTGTATSTASATLTAGDNCGCGPFGEPYVWEVVIAGITNQPGGCANCTIMNGTHRLVYAGKVGTYCFWAFDFGEYLANFQGLPCPGIEGSWLVLVTDGVIHELQFFTNGPTSTNLTFYYRATGAWVCNAPNVFTLGTSIGCDNMPPTLTIYPG